MVRLRFPDAGSFAAANRGLDPLRADERLRIVEVPTDGSAADLHRLLGPVLDGGDRLAGGLDPPPDASTTSSSTSPPTDPTPVPPPT